MSIHLDTINRRSQGLPSLLEHVLALAPISAARIHISAGSLRVRGLDDLGVPRSLYTLAPVGSDPRSYYCDGQEISQELYDSYLRGFLVQSIECDERARFEIEFEGGRL